MAAPRGLWLINHPFIALFALGGLLVLVYYAAILIAVVAVVAALLMAVAAVVAALVWAARRLTRKAS